MLINDNLHYKETASHARNRFYTTIKTLNPSKNKVRIIHLSSGILELWKVFLT